MKIIVYILIITFSYLYIFIFVMFFKLLKARLRSSSHFPGFLFSDKQWKKLEEPNEKELRELKEFMEKLVNNKWVKNG